MNMPDLLTDKPTKTQEPSASMASADAPVTMDKSEEGVTLDGGFDSEDFASGSPNDFESDAWRKEMQAELGIDGDEDADADFGAEWEKDLADELDELQAEIDI